MARNSSCLLAVGYLHEAVAAPGSASRRLDVTVTSDVRLFAGAGYHKSCQKFPCDRTM
jgi:hypothetical protein